MRGFQTRIAPGSTEKSFLRRRRQQLQIEQGQEIDRAKLPIKTGKRSVCAVRFSYALRASRTE